MRSSISLRPSLSTVALFKGVPFREASLRVSYFSPIVSSSVSSWKFKVRFFICTFYLAESRSWPERAGGSAG